MDLGDFFFNLIRSFFWNLPKDHRRNDVDTAQCNQSGVKSSTNCRGSKVLTK
jgi:hypothetical protein